VASPCRRRNHPLRDRRHGDATGERGGKGDDAGSAGDMHGGPFQARAYGKAPPPQANG